MSSFQKDKRATYFSMALLSYSIKKQKVLADFLALTHAVDQLIVNKLSVNCH